jgi:MoaA/NifB/PqqE/SkfB family radical SAM enzyme
VIAPLTPRELKIEITAACNLNCTFCYLGGKVRRDQSFMPEAEVMRWIDWAVDNGIPGIRFTGGEATLHPQLEMFCYYAHLCGRKIILNTNGMGRAELYRTLFPVVDDLRLSLPTLDAGRLDEITGGLDLLAGKEKVIKLALELGVPRICLLTPLMPELHGTLEQYVRFAKKSPRIFWLPLRYESTPILPRPWSNADAQAFAEEMADLMARYPNQAQGIFLATPFCAIKPTELGARVFHGRTEDCGPFVALNVNARGRMQGCFEVGEMEGVRPLGEIRACASVEALPAECRLCTHVTRCAGGCRKPYALVQCGDRMIDYLAGYLYRLP